MELNLDVNITWKENVRKIWQFMFAGYVDFLQKNKVYFLYLEILEFPRIHPTCSGNKASS